MTDLKMTAKRVAELEGAQLDWAVLVALGYRHSSGPWWMKPGAEMIKDYAFAPSSDWNAVGPIMEREITAHGRNPDGSVWAHCGNRVGEGSGLLLAAMRAFVASKLGDVVEVPE